MKADRLLSILLQLQARGRLTSHELAKRLEVSMRTIHRDMESLSAAGVPVFALRGSQGGWQLEENWQTDVPGLDETELRAFLMAQPQVLGDRRLAAAAERGLGKLLAAMPTALRKQAASMRQRLYVDAFSWRSTPDDLSALPLLQDAVARDRRLSFVYAGKGYRGDPACSSPQERIVDPLGLVVKGLTWYLVARYRNEPRTFRVSRMSKVKLLSTAVNRPARFDLEKYWNEFTQQFEKQMPAYEAILALKPETAEELKKWISVNAVRPEKSQLQGWILARVVFDDARHAQFVVQGLGANARVVAPADLKERVLSSARSVLRLNDNKRRDGILASSQSADAG